MIEIGLALGSAVVLMMGHLALTILHLGAGRYREAFESAEYVCDRKPVGWTSQTLPLAIEAAVRCGERRRAEEFLVELDTRANASRTAWAQGLLARSKALVSKGADAERLFEESVTLLGQTMVPRDIAHTRLLYGEWLRREDRRVDARFQLRAAHEFFVSMGAMGFAKRADAELLATGERVRRRPLGGDNGLTPQELRIAQLAAERYTNPEIASRLFISTVTVDYHLRKVFRKLNVSSRRQLRDALGPVLEESSPQAL
jgi:DNA-binding CsgD family transcriptional regulator